MEIKGKYYLVGYKNVSYAALRSDVGNRIMTMYPLIDFSAVYGLHEDDSTGFSLRSTTKHSDVSEIAVSLGGGGHACASGVYVNYPTTHLPGKVYDTSDVYELIKRAYIDEFTILQIADENKIGPVEVKKEKHYSVIYIYSPKNKKKLAKYLLQNRTSQTQVAACINSQWDSKHFLLAAAFSYNPIDDETTFVVEFDKSLSEEEIKMLSEALKLDNTRKRKVAGCVKKL
jgi:hypothetical protein